MSLFGHTLSTSDFNSWHILGTNTESCDSIYSKLKLEIDEGECQSKNNHNSQENCIIKKLRIQ